MKIVPICAGLVLAAGLGVAGQQSAPASQASAGPVIRATSQEVLLDLIVRDKKGRAVRDLRPEEIEVFDNGEKEKLTSFRLNEDSGPNGAGRNAESTTAGKPLDPLRQVRLVTLVFERLGQDARNLSRQAAFDLLKNQSGPNLYFGVFSIDQRLAVLQQYTSDKEAVRKAITKATGGNYSLFIEESDKIARELRAISEQSATNSADYVAPRMAQMTLNMLQFNQAMDRTQQGRASIFSLMSVMKEQYRLPGRKTLLYFTEGLFVPENLTEQFKSMIGIANRSNVSVYAIDAKGLVSYSQNSMGTAMLDQAARTSQSQAEDPTDRADFERAKALDLAHDATRGNMQNALADLSESTGGFLIANSNDLRVPLRHVSEDISTYYEVAYTPTIEKYDGTFRKIAVRISRPDVKVQTRSGYFAIPVIEGEQVMPYEMPMLNALTATPLPRAVPFHSAAMHFDYTNGDANTAVVVDVPLDQITFVKDEMVKAYRTHLSVMALVKNGAGEIVRKISQDVPVQGPLDKLDAFRTGRFIYTQHFPLAPGRYTLETAVLDRNDMRVGARRASLVVPPPPAGVGLSSMAVVRRVEPRNTTAETGDPFEFPGGKITPTLADSIPGGPGAKLSTYFVIYRNANTVGTPQLFLDILADGKIIARGTPELPPADAQGRIPYIATSPIESFKPGVYEIRATVKQGEATAQQRLMVTIQ